MTAKVQALAERLLGTSERPADEIEALSIEECHELDAIVMQCVGCNWWVATEDCDDEGVCSECNQSVTQ